MTGKIFFTRTLAALILGTTMLALSAYGDEVGEPYIDHLKKENPNLNTPTTEIDNQSPYIDSIKAKMKNGGDNSEGYTEKIEKQLSGGNPTPQASSSYTGDLKDKVGSGDDKSAIDAVKNGDSSLKYEKKGEIHNSFGLKFGVGLTRKVTAEDGIGTGQSFNGVYGSNYAPDIALYYEYQFLRGYTGKLGVFAMAEFGIFKGLGTFQVQPVDAGNPGSFLPATSGVQFTYVEVPTVVGLDYRFSLFKYVEPFIMGGPDFIGGVETRNDGNGNHWTLSYGAYGAVGLSFMMDWVSRRDDWDRYDELNVKHTYLSLEYGDLKSIGGAVNYNINGPYAGVTFEF